MVAAMGRGVLQLEGARVSGRHRAAELGDRRPGACRRACRNTLSVSARFLTALPGLVSGIGQQVHGAGARSGPTAAAECGFLDRRLATTKFASKSKRASGAQIDHHAIRVMTTAHKRAPSREKSVMRSTVKLLPGRLFFTRLTFTVHWRPVSSSHFGAAAGVP